ncbi:MAG TPA: rhodanese-like domain-containing protein [Candidatus Eisenbacteria bacterium]|nr:rhodanese-like domain-containing protein [Candidatus Eisenbacteria bacterium]
MLLLVVLTACSSNAHKSAPTDAAAPHGATPPGDSVAALPSVPPPEASAAATAPIPTADAWAAIRSGALLVDVRTKAEFDQGHLEGALLIPHDHMAARASELGDDKTRAIVLYCRTGNRSNQAKKALERLGFTNVMNAGGYERLQRGE